jgi:hypothetical protein
MDALRIDTLGSAPTGATRVLQSALDAQALAVPPAPALTDLLGGTSETAASGDTLSATSVAQEASLALLAVLNPSQTPEEAAETPAAITPVPEVAQPEPTAATAANATPSTPSASDTATQVPSVLQAAQDSATTDFALQTALRFGSGVGTAAAWATAAPNQAPAAVRQPEAVLRAGAVQSESQGAASEAFGRSQTARQALQTYAPPAQPEAETQVDLLV